MTFFDMDKERTRIDPRAEGPSFKLFGQEFHCLPGLPGTVTQRMALSIRVDERGRQVYNAPNVIAFIEETLRERVWVEDAVITATVTDDDSPDADIVPLESAGHWEDCDDRQRFIRAIEGTEDIIELEDLVKLMNHLSEWYGERPTKRSAR